MTLDIGEQGEAMYDSPDGPVRSTDSEPLVAVARRVQQANMVEPLITGTTAHMLDAHAAPCSVANPDEKIRRLTMMAAKLLAVDDCLILLLDGGARDRMSFRAYSSGCPGSANAYQEWTRQGESAAREAIKAARPLRIDKHVVLSIAGSQSQTGRSKPCIIASPIRVGSNIVGAVNLISLGDTRGLDSDGLAAAEIVASLIGEALHVLHLEKLLNSRFAQFAVAAEAGHTLGDASALASARPEQLARILAKSFYREMLKLGFASGQIIGAASEIISQLSGSLKKHSDRWHRTGKNRHEPG